MTILDNNKIKTFARIALMFSDIFAVFVPALIIYTFVDVSNGDQNFRVKAIIGIFLFAVSILFSSQTLYEQYSIRRSFYDEILELLQIFVFNGMAALSALFVFDLSTEKNKHILFLLSVFVSIPFFRMVTRSILHRFNFWKMNCIVFCPRSEFKFVKAAIESQFNLGFKVRRSSLENRFLINILRGNGVGGQLNPALLRSEIQRNHELIGSPHIIIYAHKKNVEYLPKLIELITHAGLPYSLIPDVAGASLLGMRLSHFFRWELLLITPQHNIERITFQFFKRFFDLCMSFIFIAAFLIPMLMIYLLIIIDGGSGIYCHERVGKNGRYFTCFKFRSMVLNSNNFLDEYLIRNDAAAREWAMSQKLTHDPRITKIGFFLRKYSLDELPQLFNVFLGDMSLVGPRPIVAEEIARYGANIEMYYKVRPGMTGLWQISGRSKTSYDYRVSLDVWYIKNWSIWYDLGILVKTVGVVLGKVGSH